MNRIYIDNEKILIKNNYGDINQYSITDKNAIDIITNEDFAIYDGYLQLLTLFKYNPDLDESLIIDNLKQDMYLAGLMLQKPKKRFNELEIEKILNYPLEKLLPNQERVFKEIELPFLVRMAKIFSNSPFILNVDDYKRLRVKVYQEISDKKLLFYHKYGFELNPNSNKCLTNIFHSIKLESPKKTAKGSPSYDSDAFSKLLADDTLTEEQRECLLLIQHIKENVNLMSMLDNLPTHIEGLEAQSRVLLSPIVNQIGEDGTSRVYTTSPSINQFPQQLRGCIQPPAGKRLIHADWSCAELQILATLSNDEVLLNDLSSNDFHKMTASRIFNTSIDSVSHEQREIAKVVNYSINYGCTAKTLAFKLNISEDEAQSIITNYNTVYNKSFQYKNSLLQFCKEKKTTYTSFLRPRMLDYSSDPEGAKRQAINTHIQGTCADLFKIVFKRFNDSKIKPVFGVFDSFQFICDDNITDDEIKDILDSKITEFQLYNFLENKSYNLKFSYSFGTSNKNWLEAINNSK